MTDTATQITGNIHSIETMGLVDGPGVRTIFFLQGCPLRCAYCHNPDSQPMNSAAARQMTPRDVLNIALRQKNYYGQEGGVTFSGGEPLAQGAFLLACLQLLKKEGISTAVDTSGFGQPAYYSRILPLVDTLILDVKAFRSGTFQSLVQGAFPVFLRFIEDVLKADFTGQLWIRHVMLPGYTDNEAAMRELVKLVRPLAFLIDRIEILPYHTMGVGKYAELGIPYRLVGVPPMDPDKAKQLERYAHRYYLRTLPKAQLRQTPTPLPLPAFPQQKESQNALERKTDFRADPTADASPYIREGIDLRKLPLLRHLSVSEFEEMAQDVAIKRVKKGELIFKSGDSAGRLFICCAGQFKIFTHTPDGREQIMYIYSPGDFVGGLNLLKGHQYLYNGQALEDAVICTMSKAFFDRVCLPNPRILQQILEKSYDRIRWAEELMTRLYATNAGMKVAELVLRLAARYGTQTAEGMRVELNLNREELGSYAGLTRESITRKLGEFKDLGYVDFEGNRVIIIKDEQALRDHILAG